MPKPTAQQKIALGLEAMLQFGILSKGSSRYKRKQFNLELNNESPKHPLPG